MVAAHLLKFCHYYEDSHGIDAALYYLRDLETSTLLRPAFGCTLRSNSMRYAC